MPTRARQVEEPIGRKPRFFRRRPGPRRTFASVSKVWGSYGRNQEVGQYNRHTTKRPNLCPPSAVRTHRNAAPLRKARLGFLLAGQHGSFRRSSPTEIKSPGATIECVTSSKEMLATCGTKLKLAFPLRRRRSLSQTWAAAQPSCLALTANALPPSRNVVVSVHQPPQPPPPPSPLPSPRRTIAP